MPLKRFTNSGRNPLPPRSGSWFFNCETICSIIFLGNSPLSGSPLRKIICEAIFEVRMIIVFLKFTTSPRASATSPSSNTERSVSQMPGNPFSHSSNSNTEYGCFFTNSVISPPASRSLLSPGGEPIRRATDDGACNSPQSKRFIAPSSPNITSAIALTNSVLCVTT